MVGIGVRPLMLPPIWLALHGHWLWWAALAGALAGGWLLERALRGRRSRRAWRARTSALLRARPEGEPAASLTGTLRVEGAAAERFEDGAPAAAASAAAGPRVERDAASVSVRAERVWLDTRHGPIELCGPIEVVGGRAVRTAGAPIGQAWARLSAALGNEPDWPFTSLPVELRSVAPGDRVEALGVLERARDGEVAGYRSAMRRVLVPCEGSILVAPGAQAPARAWRGPLACVFLFALANAIVTRPPERWDREVDALALVNPVTRSRALEVLAEAIPAEAEEALANGRRISPARSRSPWRSRPRWRARTTRGCSARAGSSRRCCACLRAAWRERAGTAPEGSCASASSPSTSRDARRRPSKRGITWSTSSTRRACTRESAATSRPSSSRRRRRRSSGTTSRRRARPSTSSSGVAATDLASAGRSSSPSA
ncbi:MAG: hypothetical protein M5U28_02855 [Sandaracinaceae bacterium]|nr:hypothetical protein [Sandaracinaceae bacterium]